MTDKLTPEQRRRVAEAVEVGPAIWAPDVLAEQWKALVRWLAHHATDREWRIVQDDIEVNDVDALERAVYEILESKDG